MLIRLLRLALLLLVPGVVLADDIVVNEYAGRDYYHLEFELRRGNFTILPPVEFQRAEQLGKIAPASNGYFEIFIRKDAFPVEAPNCENGFLKLVMPGGGEGAVCAKAEIWEQVLEVLDGTRESLGVVIELNPYCRLECSNPPRVSLDYCNIYFRTAFGHYCATLSPLSETNLLD
jgi:hypothetical protein